MALRIFSEAFRWTFTRPDKARCLNQADSGLPQLYPAEFLAPCFPGRKKTGLVGFAIFNIYGSIFVRDLT